MVVDVVALVVTYLLLAAYLSVTAHVAARNVLGDVPIDRALLVGPVPAAVSFLLQSAPPLLTVFVAVASALVAFRRVYRIRWRIAALTALIHFVVTVLATIVLGGILVLITGGPTGPW